jgi:hypothetical protein
MRAGLFIICCSFILTGCKSKNKIPTGILPQKKMQAVLWDMMRADQFLADFVLKKDSGLDKKTESMKLYKEVFAIHQISKEQFRESFSFFKSRPELFKVIMDSLSQPKKETFAGLTKQPVIRDSTNPSLPGTVKADSAIPFRKKKVIPLN